MKVTVKPSALHGRVQAPVSKSSFQRGCAAALLHKGATIIDNMGNSNDDQAAMDIITKLGATYAIEGDRLKVESNGVQPISSIIDCGESGLSIRMFTPIASLSNMPISISGKGSLLQRPMHFFNEILPQLRVACRSVNGYLPLAIQGPLKPASIEVDGGLSSQFLTGLLMAFSAAQASDVTIVVNNLKSRPYIDLTLDVMQQFGMHTPSHTGYKEFYFGNLDKQRLTANETIMYTAEGDWSGGAFLLVAGAIAGPIKVTGLNRASTQADKEIITAMMRANASIAMDAKEITVHPGGLTGFEFDATDCPDLFPPLAALAAYCTGDSYIKGASRLVHKESNRSHALQEELGKMGILVDVNDDVMHIQGSSKITGAATHAHHDHRIAMACAVVALAANGDTTIEDAEAVNKSYPNFYNDLRSLGAHIPKNITFNFYE